MINILERLHNATLANSRCTAVFQPMLREYVRQLKLKNPDPDFDPGHIKLVVIPWDTRHIPIPHSSCFTHQIRLYSTKIHGNAIVKLVGCGMDAKGYFLFMLNASTSPSCTDQGMARYLLEVEATQG